MDANTSEQTFPCFMQCRAGDPSTDSSYVSARLKIGPHEIIVDFHIECFELFKEWRLGSGSRYAQYELLFQEMINRAA
jgi:hypothetical protein